QHHRQAGRPDDEGQGGRAEKADGQRGVRRRALPRRTAAGHQGPRLVQGQGHQERHPPGQDLRGKRPVRHHAGRSGRRGRRQRRRGQSQRRMTGKEGIASMAHPLEKIIGYTFKDPGLLATALTHTSYANESRVPVAHNERLEFLGDSVLQIVSADYLFHAYADRPEGDLPRSRSSLVSEGALFQFAQEIHLGEYLRLGKGEERCGGRERPSVVSDAFEALIAALYLDGGMEVAKKFILPFITEGKHAEADYKTRLQ